MLEQFEKPDEELIVRKYYKDSEELILEIGEEIYYEADDWNEMDLEFWAEENDLLAPEEGYLEEDGTINYESLRDLKKSQEEECPEPFNTPSGRAFSFFERTGLRFPKELTLKLVDGPSPGDSWQGVEITGLENLELLQKFLKQNGFRVNFILP